MTKPFRPMLASDAVDLTKLKYPKLVSAKIDGIRCLIKDGMAVTRTLKPIPNLYARKLLSELPNGCDGELVTLDAKGKIKSFNEIQSEIMSHEGRPDFQYLTFDSFACGSVDTSWEHYQNRSIMLVGAVPNFIKIHYSHRVLNAVQAQQFYERCLDEGFEGMMLRDPEGPYKFGRSTLKEEFLLKYKPWKDAEAVILELEEQMQNTSEKTVDALGLTKRFRRLDNLKGKATLGNFVVKGVNGDFKKKIFRIGSGLDDKARAEIWANKEKYIGQILTYKYLPHGSKDAPRHPVFKGFRALGDFETDY